IQSIIDFSGAYKEKVVLYHPEKARKVFLVGLGEAKDTAKCSDAFRSLAFHHQKNWAKNSYIDLSNLPVEMAYHTTLGCQLSTYEMGAFQAEKKKELTLKKGTITLVSNHKKTKQWANEGQLTATTQIEMIRLVNSPANEKTPRFIANYAVQSGKKHGFDVEVLGEKELKKEGLHTVLAVGQGSRYESVMIKMEYLPKNSSSKRPKLGLVGKGVTFDTGGLSIKGAMNMHYMKSDMGGAAAVLGAIELAAKLQLDIHVVGLIPSVENAVDANSVKPGDVINSYSGKTIEIIDTDAEGRLILADGLAYIQKSYQPETVINAATLTGSTVRTLGYAAGGLFTQNDTLAKELTTVGHETHERLWPLPLWDDYAPDIASDIADVRNFSGKMVAGAIAAGKFLEFFIKDHPRWAHLDIAGVAFGDSEYSKMKGATGFGVRLLVAYMKSLLDTGC
ncbi:MAG: leucyl aminopeptidase family protein, partial [Bacteroidota bacterium]